MTLARKILKWGFYTIYLPASKVWRWLDHTASWGQIRYWIENVPDEIFTPAPYVSYGCWMHNQGFFVALFSLYLKKPQPNIFDFGCGMGALAPVAHYFVKDGGRYVGVDTDAASIRACLKTYPSLKNCEFYRTSDANPFYPQDQPLEKRNDIDWPAPDDSQDLLVAMSVFTHLQEQDAHRYMDKICRVLKPGGRAILSFLIVREDYIKVHNPHKLHYELTPGWFTSNQRCPENCIAITRDALERLIGRRFQVLAHIESSAMGGRHPALQDIFILERTTSA